MGQLSCKITFGIKMKFWYLQRLLDCFSVFFSVRHSSLPSIVMSDHKISALANFRPHFWVISSVENTTLWFDPWAFRLLQAIGSILQLVLRRVRHNNNSALFWYMTFLHWSVTGTGWFQCLCLYWKIGKKSVKTEICFNLIREKKKKKNLKLFGEFGF